VVEVGGTVVVVEVVVEMGVVDIVEGAVVEVDDSSFGPGVSEVMAVAPSEFSVRTSTLGEMLPTVVAQLASKNEIAVAAAGIDRRATECRDPTRQFADVRGRS
jgi:hypothetical protein